MAADPGFEPGLKAYYLTHEQVLALGLGDLIAGAEINMSSPVLTTGVDTPVEFGSVISDSEGILDVANNEVIVPTLETGGGTNRGVHVEAVFKGLMIASAANYLAMEMEFWNGSAWTKWANGKARVVKPMVNIAVGSPAFIHFDIALYQVIPSAGAPTDGRTRFVMFHDDAASITTIFTHGHVALRNIHGSGVSEV